MKKIVTFGEIMGRFATRRKLRFRQAAPGALDLTFAGAEASVAVSLKIMGRESEFVTALPDHGIAEACLDSLRRFGVGTDHIVIGDKGRLGLYFLETGANQRPSQVIYDRADSSVSICPFEDYDWDGIFDDAQWFHISGITPALSENSADVVIRAVKEAERKEVSVSCDLNFRNKLWKWHPSIGGSELAEETMRKILPYVKVLVGNEEDAEKVLGIQAANTDVASGKLDIPKYSDVARRIADQFADIEYIAITLRESISADHNNWGAMLYSVRDEKTYLSPGGAEEYRPYRIRNIVDRLGGGDAFAAGLIYGFTDEQLREHPGDILDYAVAASCLAHSTEGDFNYTTRDEVLALVRGNASGRVKR